MEMNLDEKYSRQVLFAGLGEKGQQRLLKSSAVLVGCGALGTGCDLILDGTDNFETRFLMNDAALRFGVPWIYAAAVASYGVTMTIRPGETACLACLLESRAETGLMETCDTAGILGAIVGVIS